MSLDIGNHSATVCWPWMYGMQLVTGDGPRGIQRGDIRGGDRLWHAAWLDRARPWLWWCTGQQIISVWHLAAYRLLLSLACGRTNGPIYSWAALNPVGGKARCLHVSRGLQCYVARQAAFQPLRHPWPTSSRSWRPISASSALCTVDLRSVRAAWGSLAPLSALSARAALRAARTSAVAGGRPGPRGLPAALAPGGLSTLRLQGRGWAASKGGAVGPSTRLVC